MPHDFHCQVCDKDFERIKLPGNHLQRRRICDDCREWFCWCNRCKTAKLYSDFEKCASSKTGIQSKCRICRIDACGLIRVRKCGHCAAEYVVSEHRKYNGKTPWLCGDCYLVVKHCATCGLTKQVGQFSLSSSKRVGRVAHCKACHSARWSASGHENRTRAKRARFGLSYDAYLAMCIEHGNRCRICGQAESELDGRSERARELAIDHDHKTGQIRGLLCGRCNKAIGLMLDNPERLRAAAAYLETFVTQSNSTGVI